MTTARQRHADPDVNEALARVVRDMAPPWAVPYARPVEVTFPVADAPRQVRHGVGAVPDGVLVVLATGPVVAVTPDLWTEEIAILASSTVNTFARLWFYRLRQSPEPV
jgi:hypothetical protein